MQRALPSLLVLWAAAAAPSAHAQGGPPQGDTVTVGIGVGVTSSYDGARDYKLIPGGTLRGTVGRHDFQLNGLQLFVDAVPNDPQRKIDFELGPVAGVRFNRTGDVSDSRVAALGELDTAVELGARGSVGLRGILNREGNPGTNGQKSPDPGSPYMGGTQKSERRDTAYDLPHQRVVASALLYPF